MPLTRAERERIAELRRAATPPDGQAMGWLESLRRVATPSGADRRAIEATMHGRRADDGTPSAPFGADGDQEFDRRVSAGHFARWGHVGPVQKDDGATPADAEARGFWNAFDHQQRSS